MANSRCREIPVAKAFCTFLERVVAFPSVLAGNQREALLAAADQLSLELGYAEVEETPGADSSLCDEGALAGILDDEDEMLVRGMRRALARVAAALGGEDPEGAVCAALDGTEIVMRGELVRGNAARLPELMPSFVFLVALPLVDQDRALELSKRSARLVERALGERPARPER